MQSITDLLLSIHCHLDDGGLNEAGAALYKARKALAENASPWTVEDLAWLADLDSLYHACIGSL